MGTPNHPPDDGKVELGRLLYASEPAAGPASAFQPLSVRKIDAGVATVINSRFGRHKHEGPA